MLTRLPAAGHSDARVGETLAEMRRLGIQLEFADAGWPIPEPRRIPPLQPAADIVLDLSILIALCCDSTHHPLPADEYELESRFRTMRLDEGGEGAEGPAGAGAERQKLVLGTYTNATRDLRDQLRCELARPLLTELMFRLGGRPARFWVTREVRARLPTLVDVIGGERERYRAQAMFGDDDFWAGSRWEGQVGENLRDFRVGVLDEPDTGAAEPENGAEALPTPFDAAVAHVCREMLRVAEDTPAAATPGPGTPAPAETPAPIATPPNGANGTSTSDTKPRRKTKSKASRNPQRAAAGTRFSNSKLPSGHTLRTLLAGIEQGMTVLTNNRGAVLKVLREEGVMDGIPFAYPSEQGSSGEVGENSIETGEDGDDSTEGSGGSTRARIWIVNPSSLAEWRRIQVERGNAELRAQYPDAEVERAV